MSSQLENDLLSGMNGAVQGRERQNEGGHVALSPEELHEMITRSLSLLSASVFDLFLSFFSSLLFSSLLCFVFDPLSFLKIGEPTQ